MTLLVLLIVGTIVAVFLIAASVYEKNAFGTFFAGAFAFAFLILVVFVVAPQELGWGHVPDKAEVFTKRLDAGVAYQLLASSKVGDDQVLLVEKTGTSDFYALRVKEVPPEHFTLVDGKPVAIAAPVPPVGVK